MPDAGRRGRKEGSATRARPAQGWGQSDRGLPGRFAQTGELRPLAPAAPLFAARLGPLGTGSVAVNYLMVWTLASGQLWCVVSRGGWVRVGGDRPQRPLGVSVVQANVLTSHFIDLYQQGPGREGMPCAPGREPCPGADMGGALAPRNL